MKPVAPAAMSIPLRGYYETLLVSLLASLWRRRIYLFLAALCGLIAGILGLRFTEPRYASEAVIQLDFARVDTSKAVPTPPVAAMEAGVLVEGEARIIRSRAMAMRIAAQTGLDGEPRFAVHDTLFGRIKQSLRPTLPLTPSDNATAWLMKHVTVSNDARSYLITIAGTAETPERAALFANAFAREYIRMRALQKLQEAEGAARALLSDLERTHGDKHPSVVQARASLDEAEDRLRQSQIPSDAVPPGPARLVSEAQPVPIPVGLSAPLVIILATGFASVAAGFVAIMVDRRKTTYSGEADVALHNGVPCLGSLSGPHSEDMDAERRRLAGVTSLCLAPSRDGSPSIGQIVMVTSCAADDGCAEVGETIARLLGVDGGRVLLIDATHAGLAPGSLVLEDLIEAPEMQREVFIPPADENVVRVSRSSGLAPRRNVIGTPAFEKFCRRSSHLFSAVVIVAPPVLLLSEAIAVGRISETVVLAVRRGVTERRLVASTIELLRAASVPLSGIVLTAAEHSPRRPISLGRPVFPAENLQTFG